MKFLHIPFVCFVFRIKYGQKLGLSLPAFSAFKNGFSMHTKTGGVENA
jgi:hypothetical protein